VLYAKIVVGLAVRGPFDYIVPRSLEGKIKTGERAWVNFGTRRIIGYVVGLAKKSEVKNLKPVLELIDDYPVLTRNLLLLTKGLGEYYYCSWGEAIETAIPEGLRKGKNGYWKNGDGSIFLASDLRKIEPSPFLIHDLDGEARWDTYIAEIKKTIEKKLSVIMLLPDVSYVFKARDIIEKRLGINVGVLYRKQPGELEEWVNLRRGGVRVVVGTRSAVFAPLSNLGLIIIDDEEDSVYKQDQVPHYHARAAAFMRSKLDKARLILGSRAPSLESFHLIKAKKADYTLLPRKKEFPEVKIIDMRHLPFQDNKKRVILARLLEDAIYSVLNEKGKALLFLNRKGFATYCACHNCGKALKCPRCSINLVYHFKEGLLSCHYCNFKMPAPEICPECNSGYIKFSGAGTEKIESELSRIFPQARISIVEGDNLNLSDADIFIATSSVIRQAGLDFDLIGVLGIDSVLNRVDFRATEKVFGLLAGLLGLTHKKILIQTGSPQHHCFQALLEKDASVFYDEELRQRRQLSFPPYKHMVLLKLRGKSEDKVKESAQSLCAKLREINKNRNIEIISVNPSNPAKLRGNYHWQILIRSSRVIAVNTFLKNSLKDFRHSGIIVTVDVDPI